MSKTAFLYFASDAFKSRAKVLNDSLIKYHNDADIIQVNPQSAYPIGTYIPGMAKMRLVKALELLENGYDNVIVIGADCVLYNRLEQIDFVEFKRFDCAMVPHIHSPSPDRNWMAQLYKTGHANADLMYFSNTENGKNIVKWLISVTEEHDEKKGIFFEQTWLSAVPFLFNNVYIIRNPGYNVGYWDVNDRGLTFFNNKWHVTINDRYFPLAMAQFSGYIKGNPYKMSRYSTETCDSNVLPLYQEYDNLIES